jgi:hypothetical protein
LGGEKEAQGVGKEIFDKHEFRPNFELHS